MRPRELGVAGGLGNDEVRMGEYAADLEAFAQQPVLGHREAVAGGQRENELPGVEESHKAIIGEFGVRDVILSVSEILRL